MFKLVFRRPLLLILLVFIPSFICGHATSVIDSLIQVAEDATENKAQAYEKISQYYFSRENYSNALKNAELGIKYAKQSDNLYIIGNLTLLKAYVYLSWGLPQKAVISFSDAKKLGKKIKNSNLIVGGYHGIGRAYIELKLYDKAIKELYEGLNFKVDSTFSRRKGVFNNALGIAYQDKGVLDSALIHFNIFLEISKEKNDSINLLFSYVNIGETYNLKGNYDKAIEYFNQAMKMNMELNNIQAKAAILGNFAEVYYHQGDFQKSIEFVKRSMEICRLNNLTKFQSANYELLINDYSSLKDSASTIAYSKEFLAYKDSIYQQDKTSSINYLNAQYEIEKSIKESELLNQKLKNRSIFLYFSIALIALVSLLLILLYSRYKLRSKIHNQEKKKLNLTIDEKNRELVGKILSNTQILNESEDIINNLQKAIDSQSMEDVNQILISTKSSLQKGKPKSFNWDDFKIHFQQVHPDFFNAIKNLDVNLSTNELRHCAYIKMNLSTKEIASFLNVSDRAVQTARYRIKKKLNLGPDIDLFKFIQQF